MLFRFVLVFSITTLDWIFVLLHFIGVLISFDIQLNRWAQYLYEKMGGGGIFFWRWWLIKSKNVLYDKTLHIFFTIRHNIFFNNKVLLQPFHITIITLSQLVSTAIPKFDSSTNGRYYPTKRHFQALLFWGSKLEFSFKCRWNLTFSFSWPANGT